MSSENPGARHQQFHYSVVIGIDVGTTSVKAVAVDPGGEVVAVGESGAIDTRTSSGGASEQDANEIWSAVGAAVGQARAGLASETTVAAISMAAQSGSVVPIDDAHGATRRAITWMDTRSQPIVEAWAPEMSERIRRISGWSVSPGLGLSTIAWLSTQGRMAPRIASVDDYLVHQMTGNWVTNPSNAAGMQLTDVSRGEWSSELCAIAGTAPGALSRIMPSASVAGDLHESASRTLGLPVGTVVVVGGHDQACAALGLGVTDPGAMLLSLGTAWVFTLITDTSDMAALPTGLNLSSHVLACRWSASQNLGGLGSVIAATLHDSARLGQVFESCAFEVRRAAEQAAAFIDPSRPVILVGGGTRSDELTQTIADALGRPTVVKPDASWPALGAARLAASAQGWQEVSSDRSPGRLVEPDAETIPILDERYSIVRPNSQE